MTTGSPSWRRNGRRAGKVVRFRFAEGILDALAQPLDRDFLQAASEQPAAEHRPERDRLFD